MLRTKLSIRLDLEGDLLRKFEFLKKEKGISDNANTIRAIIADHYKATKEKEQEMTAH